MKLLTHNMLACHIKGITNNYPFLIEATKIETRDADFNPGVLCRWLCALSQNEELARHAKPVDTDALNSTSLC